MADDVERAAPLGGLRAEVVTKPDGRYLIYYSWPDEPEDGNEPADRAPPDQEPWTPQAGPIDV